jgi:hypothetical protein
MTDRTLRSFDSALRAVLPPGGEDGRIGRRGGGDDDRGGFVGVEVGVVRSELDVDVDGTASAHSDEATSEYRAPLPCAHPAVVAVANTWLAAVCGVTARELGDEDGARMDSGGNMLNIWSSE